MIICPFCRNYAVNVPAATRHVGYYCPHCGHSFALPPALGCDVDHWQTAHPVETPQSERIKLGLICETAFFLCKTKQIDKTQWEEFSQWSAEETERIDDWEDEWNRPLLEEMLRDIVV
jgi:hypothetical protein